MSVVTYDGGTITKDPYSNRVYVMDWTNDLGTAGIDTSAFVVSGPDSSLAVDNESIGTLADDVWTASSGAKMARFRLTGGTLGKTYTVTNRITTNASPAEREPASVKVLVRAQ